MTGKNRGINGKQLNGSSIDMKRHVKMYKAGKKWLAAGLSTAVLGLTVIGGQQEVNASTNLSNVEQGTSEATSSVNSSALNASSAVVLNTSSSSSNVDNSAHEDQGATVSQSIQTESSASSVGSAVSKTAQDSSTGTIQATSNSNNVQVTNLSNPSSDEITVAQSAASERYQQTGQPQQINAVAATTPVAETTGTVTVNYVNKDTGELITFNQSQSSLTADAGTVVNGSYIAKTTISAASVTKMKVNTKYAQASIAGYKFVGNDTTDFTFVPIGETKTIIAYYEQLAPLIVQYVNEDDESDIIYQNIYDVSKPGMRASGLSSYDVSYNIPELWGYTYDSSKTDQSTLKGTFKSIDDTDGQALIVKVFYKKTTSDINKGALYLTGVINQPVSDSNSNGSGDNNPSVSFNGTSLPSTAIKISNSTSTTPAQYQNYTLVEATGFSASAETYLGSSASYIPNQPVKVVFGDDSTGKVLLTKSLGDFDPANGVIPSGNYDTSVVNDEQQSSLESQGYRLLGVYGMTSGTYDEMHRVVYYMYTPKLDYGEVTVTRTINFTSSDSSAVLPNPEVQEVTYKTVKNEVTGEIVYTPQEAFYEYIVPNVENYTASQSKVDQEALAPSTTAPTNQTVTINYTPALVHGEVTVDRTISYEKINGSKLQADTVQQVTYKFETNKVSGETVYTPQGFYPAIVSPSFSGYQTTQTTINQDLLKPTTETPKSTKMVVSYTPNKQRATVEIVDQNGKKLDTINVEGVSDGAVD
ncbi:mucin-binding protein, partial [Paucilactobacillus vaccinostercus]|uniref:mucin-binding protein n=1 Tax=Paucilactobacillus vaccinostercus TaxID=176291 RepID=UPI00192CF489